MNPTSFHYVENRGIARITFARPQKRMMSEDEVARLVAFLAEPGQAGINGQGINLDGGAVFS